MKTPSRADGKARKMYANFYKWADGPITVHLNKTDASKARGWPCEGHGPVAVSELSPRADAARIEVAASSHFDRIHKSIKSPARWKDASPAMRASYLADARALLTALNLLTPVPAKQGKK